MVRTQYRCRCYQVRSSPIVSSSHLTFFISTRISYILRYDRTLVHAFPEAGLGVSIASDSQIFQSDVFAASHPPMGSPSSKKKLASTWGGRAVLVLIGIRLGLDGVNPIYYETIKVGWVLIVWTFFFFLFTSNSPPFPYPFISYSSSHESLLNCTSAFFNITCLSALLIFSITSI